MTDRSWIQPIVERVVSQTLETHASRLRDEIVRRVMEQVAAEPLPEVTSPAGSTSADLARAVAEIQLGTSQKEILKALLDGAAHYATRVALFVVKGGSASGWQGRGFHSNEVKDFILDVQSHTVARALTERAPASGPAPELDQRFIEKFGAPAAEGRFLPLVLKDKVAALVYADGGTDGAGLLEPGSLDLLVMATSAWLELTSLRKFAHKEPADVPHESRPVAAAASAQAFNDPFAAHAPKHAMAVAATAEATPAMTAVAEPEPVETLAPASAAAASESVPVDAASSEEQEIHHKAQRFARLLVDEVKLYNQAKVTEGRKHKDLYDRLKEAIEKSRATYQKRYGNTVAASGNYFQHELIRSLAEDDVSIMGANFPH